MSYPYSYNASPSSAPISDYLDIPCLPNTPSCFDLNIDPNLQNSQLTAISLYDSEFATPILLPTCLQRVGPDQRRLFVLFDAMNNISKESFIEWWRTTIRGGEPETQRNVR